MKHIFIFIINIYRGFGFILEQLGLKKEVCRFTPSCSAYAKDAFATFGAGKGLLLSFKRIIKCHPGSPGAYDPVPKKKLTGFQHTNQLSG